MIDNNAKYLLEEDLKLLRKYAKTYVDTHGRDLAVKGPISQIDLDMHLKLAYKDGFMKGFYYALGVFTNE